MQEKKKTWAISSGIVGEAETTGAAGRDKSAKASKGFGLPCHRLRQRDVNQLQRKTGPHFLSPCLQRTLFSRRGEERPSFKDSAELTPRVHVRPPIPSSRSLSQSVCREVKHTLDVRAQSSSTVPGRSGTLQFGSGRVLLWLNDLFVCI